MTHSIDYFNWISEVRLIQLKLSIEVINWSKPIQSDSIDYFYRIGSIDNFNWISEVRLIQLKLSILQLNWFNWIGSIEPIL